MPYKGTKAKKTVIREQIDRGAKEAAAIFLGQKIAEEKMDKKKPIYQPILKHLGVMVDNLDVMEVAAIGATTLILQPAVYGAGNFLESYKKIVENSYGGAYTFSSGLITGDESKQLLGGLQLSSGLTGIFGLFPIFNTLFPQFQLGSEAIGKAASQVEAEQKYANQLSNLGIKELEKKRLKDEENRKILFSYIIAFVIAFIIIRYGADILKGLGGINGIVGLLGGIGL